MDWIIATPLVKYHPMSWYLLICRALLMYAINVEPETQTAFHPLFFHAAQFSSFSFSVQIDVIILLALLIFYYSYFLRWHFHSWPLKCFSNHFIMYFMRMDYILYYFNVRQSYKQTNNITRRRRQQRRRWRWKKILILKMKKTTKKMRLYENGLTVSGLLSERKGKAKTSKSTKARAMKISNIWHSIQPWSKHKFSIAYTYIHKIQMDGWLVGRSRTATKHKQEDKKFSVSKTKHKSAKSFKKLFISIWFFSFVLSSISFSARPLWQAFTFVWNSTQQTDKNVYGWDSFFFLVDSHCVGTKTETHTHSVVVLLAPTVTHTLRQMRIK